VGDVDEGDGISITIFWIVLICWEEAVRVLGNLDLMKINEVSRAGPRSRCGKKEIFNASDPSHRHEYFSFMGIRAATPSRYYAD